MRSSGDSVTACSGQPPDGEAAFAAGRAEGHPDCVPACWQRPGRRQAVQAPHGGRTARCGRQGKLVRTTGAPTPFAAVMDSDACEVRGPDPSGLRRSTLLDQAMVAAYGMPESPGGPAYPTDPTGRCAAEAGFAADPVALGGVLTEPADLFVEDLVFALVDACGCPPVIPTELGRPAR